MGDGCVVELNRMFSTPCGTAWGRIGPHGTVGYPLYGTVWDCMGLYGYGAVWDTRSRVSDARVHML